ncbi:hypothetical protein [Mycolicibacterium sp. XJ1819]
MAIVRGVDETGEGAFYDVPDEELSKYKLKAKHFDTLSEEDKQRLLDGATELTKENAQGAIPIGSRAGGGDVEGFTDWCWIYLWDEWGNWVYVEGPC